MGDYDYEIYQDGTWYSPKALGMIDPVLSLAAGAVGTLSFSVKKTPAETAPWAKKEVIRVRRVVTAGTTYDYLFNGKIVSEDPGETPEPSISYKAEDVWGELDRRPCEVLWDFDSATFNGSHLILFRDQDGEQMTVGEQIKDALDYAIDKDISITYTQAELDDLDEEPPSDEQSDLSVAQVIKRGLRWVPGCRAVITYASDGSSAIHFERSDDPSVTAVSIDVAGGDVLTYNVKDSDNLRVDGVKIIFEVTNTDLDGTSVSMVTDEAGDLDGDNVLVNTIELEGSFTEALSETIEVVAWPSNPALQADSVYNFWEAICPWFREYMEGNPARQISYVNSYWIIPWPAALSYVLVSGSIQSWMGGSTGSAQTYCNYDYDSENAGDRSNTEAPVVTTTDLTSGTYTGTLVNLGEPVPTGLAAAIYAARNADQFSGKIEIKGARNHGVLTPRDYINLTNGRTGWTDMDAQIQRIEHNIRTDRLTVSFGFPEHLTPEDWISLVQPGRDRNKPTRRTWRS